jgi:hypothetical protein
VVGSTLFVKLPGMEFAPLAAIEAGADVVAVQAALATWFIPILVTGVIAFAVGVFAFAKGIARRTARRVALYEDDHRLPKTLSSAGLSGSQNGVGWRQKISRNEFDTQRGGAILL